MSPSRAALMLLASLALVFGALEIALRVVLGGTLAPSLHLAVFFIGFDVGLGAVLLLAVRARLAVERAARAERERVPADPLPALSVLVAAFDEEEVIVETVRAIAAQRGACFEIVVGDDGSRDGTVRLLRETFSLSPGVVVGTLVGEVRGEDGVVIPITVARRAHAGKGATLNAAAELAAHPILITVDADTVPAEGALAAMARAFLDPEIDSAAGVVTIGNARRSWLLASQHAEYEKNAIVRIGWSALGALEQVPGAFTGIRARAFADAGGFPDDSLTEDYELTYRLIDHGVRAGRVPVVAVVPAAQVLTHGPSTLAGFVRQRTRWFAGFLTTLARFRRLIGSPRAGGFGVVRFPLKVVDAVLPVLAFGTLFVLGRAGFFGLLPASRAAAFLFGVRWVWDLFFYAMADRFSRALGAPAANRAAHPPLWVAWLCTATEALTYVWIKHVATLRAYVWAARRVRTWERSRPVALRAGSVGEDVALRESR